MSRKWIVLVPVLAAAIYTVSVWRSAQKALDAGAQATTHTDEISVSVAPWRTSAAPFETVGTPEFDSAVSFNGDSYRLGPAAFSNTSHVWHVGRELPAARLLSLAVRTGVGEPELWIATEGAGVLIYDGHLVRQLLPQASPLRKISAILPFRNGQVLLGTPTAGLYVTDGRMLRLFHPSLATTQVTALAGDEDQFWVGTRADGAWQWKGGAAVHFAKDLPDPQVLSLAMAGETAWIGTALGITEFARGKYSRQLGQGLFARTLAEHNGALSVGTLDQGTQTLLLTARQPHAAATIPVPPPLSPQHVTALHHDAHGNLWIGYFDRGLDILSERGVDHREDDHLFCINRIREHNGTIAVATANGLALFDQTTQLRQILNRTSGLIADHVTDVLFTKGSTVVATPAGLSFVDNGISSIYGFHGLVNNHVYTLAELNGTVYAGTLGGISEVRNGLVEASFTTANSELRQNWITATAVFDGQLYLGTYGSGVIAFDKAGTVTTSPAFARFRTEINPNALLSTSQALYAGTAGRGLAILRTGDQRWHFVVDGLPSLNVTALEAYNGIVYVGTDNGLVQTAERNLLP